MQSTKTHRVISIQTEIPNVIPVTKIPKQPKEIKNEKKVKKEAKEIKEKEEVKPKKANDIDDIFSQLKTKPRKKDIEQQKEEERQKRKQMKKEENKKIRRTEEGYRIYTLEELGLDKNQYGGNTPLCPFDCDCCH